MVILASRKSAFGCLNNAADTQSLPSFEVMTRSAPSGETCALPSRKTQNHLLLNRARSVNALCGAWSQIFRTSTRAVSLFASSAHAPEIEPRSNGATRKISHIQAVRGLDRNGDSERSFIWTAHNRTGLVE